MKHWTTTSASRVSAFSVIPRCLQEPSSLYVEHLPMFQRTALMMYLHLSRASLPLSQSTSSVCCLRSRNISGLRKICYKCVMRTWRPRRRTSLFQRWSPTSLPPLPKGLSSNPSNSPSSISSFVYSLLFVSCTLLSLSLCVMFQNKTKTVQDHESREQECSTYIHRQ